MLKSRQHPQRGVKVTAKTTWNRAALRRELDRRKMCPAFTDEMGFTEPQEVTVEFLEAELATMPEDRAWCEYELALAREQARLDPTVPFVRSVRKERIH
jgi:hypothetical protein